MRGNELQESFSFVNEPKGQVVRPPFEALDIARLAAEGIYIGTTSWKYRGWEGLIYKGGYVSEAQFQRVSLREYTSCFPTVGVEFTYYTWPMADMMSYLMECTPENFRLCPKVTKRITMSQFPNLPAYGKWAGQKNPDFLNPELFKEMFLQPVRRLMGRLGVILFEFSGPEEEEIEQMEKFFAAVPRDVSYAVEIRNPALVNETFYARLREMKVSPVFSLWSKMPGISEQWEAYKKAGGDQDSLPVVGLGLIRPGRSYEDAVRLFQPYKELKEPYPFGSAELAQLALDAKDKGRKAYILVSNRLEGSAPHSIGGILQKMQG